MKDMTSNQPYLLRAFFDWIIDNDCTPYMVVDANYPGVQIPTQFVNNGQIVLNVSPSACVNFSIDLEWISFQARFSGQPMLVSFPCVAVSAVYAKENGAGTVFTVPEPPAQNEAPDKQPEEKIPPLQSIDKTLTEVSAVDKSDSKGKDDIAKDTDKPKKPKNKPGLRVVK